MYILLFLLTQLSQAYGTLKINLSDLTNNNTVDLKTTDFEENVTKDLHDTVDLVIDNAHNINVHNNKLSHEDSPSSHNVLNDLDNKANKIIDNTLNTVLENESPKSDDTFNDFDKTDIVDNAQNTLVNESVTSASEGIVRNVDDANIFLGNAHNTTFKDKEESSSDAIFNDLDVTSNNIGILETVNFVPIILNPDHTSIINNDGTHNDLDHTTDDLSDEGTLNGKNNNLVENLEDNILKENEDKRNYNLLVDSDETSEIIIDNTEVSVLKGNDEVTSSDSISSDLDDASSADIEDQLQHQRQQQQQQSLHITDTRSSYSLPWWFGAGYFLLIFGAYIVPGVGLATIIGIIMAYSLGYPVL